jgi:hypothetical protein
MQQLRNVMGREDQYHNEGIKCCYLRREGLIPIEYTFNGKVGKETNIEYVE